MSVVVFPSQSLRGVMELSPFDFQAPMGFDTGFSKVDNLSKGFVANHISAPPIMNRAIQNPFAFKAIGCKSEPQTHLIIRRRALPNYIGTYPQTGVFRHEKKGLAFDTHKPNNLPIMPKASSFRFPRNHWMNAIFREARMCLPSITRISLRPGCCPAKALH